VPEGNRRRCGAAGFFFGYCNGRRDTAATARSHAQFNLKVRKRTCALTRKAPYVAFGNGVADADIHGESTPDANANNYHLCSSDKQVHNFCGVQLPELSHNNYYYQQLKSYLGGRGPLPLALLNENRYRFLMLENEKHAQAKAAGPRSSGSHESQAVRVTSRQLLGETGELIIEHKGRSYRLRVTRQGNLMLTAYGTLWQKLAPFPQLTM
jgi:hemin uptake protein HemP